MTAKAIPDGGFSALWNMTEDKATSQDPLGPRKRKAEAFSVTPPQH